MSDQSDKAGEALKLPVRAELMYINADEGFVNLMDATGFRIAMCDTLYTANAIIAALNRSPAIGSPSALHGDNARYEAGWYYCWLIERRDGPQPQWLTAGCDWTTVAYNAQWFARKSDADYVAGEFECNHHITVCEHGFALRHDSSDEGCKTCDGKGHMRSSSAAGEWVTPCPDCKGDSP